MSLMTLGILAASGGGVAGAYELIQTFTVGAGGQASVTFSNLNTYSTTYQHLQIRSLARSNRSANTEGGKINFNSDTGGNYRLHLLEGNGSSVTSLASGSGSTYLSVIGAAGNTATSALFVPSVVDILDPYEAKNKTVRSLTGGNGAITLLSGLWMNTTSLTTIAIAPEIGSAWLQGSRFSLYGIKGA